MRKNKSSSNQTKAVKSNNGSSLFKIPIAPRMLTKKMKEHSTQHAPPSSNRRHQTSIAPRNWYQAPWASPRWPTPPIPLAQLLKIPESTVTSTARKKKRMPQDHLNKNKETDANIGAEAVRSAATTRRARPRSVQAVIPGTQGYRLRSLRFRHRGRRGGARGRVWRSRSEAPGRDPSGRRRRLPPHRSLRDSTSPPFRSIGWWTRRDLQSEGLGGEMIGDEKKSSLWRREVGSLYIGMFNRPVRSGIE